MMRQYKNWKAIEYIEDRIKQIEYLGPIFLHFGKTEQNIQRNLNLMTIF